MAIEEFYSTPDPWGYQDNEDDINRADWILSVLSRYHFSKALDIGAGEGWITGMLPAKKIYGIEVSNTAASRFPKNVTRLEEPKGKYDLILATGVLYGHYDYKKLRKWIKKHALSKVLTCHYNKMDIKDRFGKPVLFSAEFPYREGKQIMKLYQW